MRIQLLLFGIVADLVGENSIELNLPEKTTVESLKKELIILYPQLKNYTTYAVAVNETYAQDSIVINNNDVVAIIPPVSGG